MRLFIAEKPSLAHSIAAVLPQPQKTTKLYIEAGDDVVAWAAGHILEQATPDQYDEKISIVYIESFLKIIYPFFG